MGISPAIVLGRVHHEKYLPKSYMKDYVIVLNLLIPSTSQNYTYQTPCYSCKQDHGLETVIRSKWRAESDLKFPTSSR